MKKALVIGLGRMGGFHAQTLQDLGFHVTTVDPDASAGADYKRVPFKASFHTVCIAVPIQHLAEQAAWWAGQCDALMIEKPMASNLREAMQLASELRSQLAAVGYVERFNPRLRELKTQLEGRTVHSASFKRWNVRRTENILLDLRSHDIDLARYLNVLDPVFNTAAGMPLQVRRITVPMDDRMYMADLMDHETSPLHDQWMDFLEARGECATAQDAVRVLERLSEPAAVAA